MHIYYYSITKSLDPEILQKDEVVITECMFSKEAILGFLKAKKKPSGSPESETWCCTLSRNISSSLQICCLKIIALHFPAHLCITLNLAARVCVHKYARNESRVVLEAVVGFAGLVDRKITLFFLFFLLNWDIPIGHQEDTVNKEPGVAVFRQALFGVGLHFRRC